MANSSDVVADQAATAQQYNNLRKDLLDGTTGHGHTGGTDGKLIAFADNADNANRADNLHFLSLNFTTAYAQGGVSSVQSNIPTDAIKSILILVLTSNNNWVPHSSIINGQSGIYFSFALEDMELGIIDIYNHPTDSSEIIHAAGRIIIIHEDF